MNEHESVRARFLAALGRFTVIDRSVFEALAVRITTGGSRKRRRAMSNDEPREYVSTGDVARVAGVSLPYVRDCIVAHELKAIPIGHGKKLKRSRIHIVEAVRFLDAKGFKVPRAWRALADALAAVALALVSFA